MIDINGSLIIQIVNFVFLIWVLNIILYKPIRQILSQRKMKMDGLQSGIDADNQEAFDKEKQFSENLKAARMKGLKEKDALVAEGESEEKRILDQIHEKVQKDLAEFRDKIAKDTEAVRVKLNNEIDDFADDIAQKILGRSA